MLAARWLERAGYDVVTANNFSDARAEIRVWRPHVVVTDIRLGEFNGIQLGILAREACPEAVLVIVSGWDDPVLRREVADLRATFIKKPLRELVLLSILGEASDPPDPGTQPSGAA